MRAKEDYLKEVQAHELIQTLIHILDGTDFEYALGYAYIDIYESVAAEAANAASDAGATDAQLLAVAAQTPLDVYTAIREALDVQLRDSWRSATSTPADRELTFEQFRSLVLFGK